MDAQTGAVLLSGVVGSTAYGLAHEGSDIDRLGVFAVPTSALCGLHPPKATHVTVSPDATFHEAGKLCSLLLSGNPTVSELLWLPEHETRTDLGEQLMEIRGTFLSAKTARNAYLGYATQQFRRLESRGDGSFSADTRKRTSKHARHLWRLLRQGVDLHQTGSLTVRLSPEDATACREFGERVGAGDIGAARKALGDAESRFDAPGVLPERPDEAPAGAWLLRVRARFWDVRGEDT